MGSGFDDWVYWHLFTITVNNSHIELLLNDVKSLATQISSTSEFLSLMLRPTISWLVYLGIKHPSGA
jgi:hypothetical protein